MTAQRIDESASARATTARRGSFLLVCIIMMSLMVIIGFAVLRNIQTQTDASTSNQRVLLAQSAAQAGLVHATEMILRDYASPTVKVGADVAGLAAGTVELPARQFLHGPFRAPFLAISAPDKPDYDVNAVDPNHQDPNHHNAPDADKDVRTEHHLARPWEAQGGWDYYHYWNGTSHMSGRARYYEPNWYDVTPQADGQIRKTSFAVIDPPQVGAPPERAEGVFYDEHFRRVDETDPVKARYKARYRLRYANDVEDLSGCLLINPMADMKLPDDYRNPPAWVQRAGDALATMMTTNFGNAPANDPWVSAHMEHVFFGRGWATNSDVSAAGFPITFPLMYRYSNPGDQYAQWETFQTWWASNNLANNLYTSPYVKGKKDGGETLFIRGGGDDRVYSHSLMGPQMSSWNFRYATDVNYRDRAWSGWGGVANPSTTLFATTPFGRSLRQPNGYPNSYHPAKRKWYEGRVNTPFCVNIMTAPPWVIDSMLVAYLPPKFKVYKYTWIQFVQYKGKNLDGGDIWDWNVPNSGMPIDGNNPANNSYQYGRDLLVDTTTPAFNEFPAPYRDATTNPPSPVAGEVIKPDYYVSDPRLPHQQSNNAVPPQQVTVSYPERIYPGIAWNGDPSKLGEGSDDAGASMNSDDLGYGVCTHTGQPFVHLDPAPPGYAAWDFQGAPFQNNDPGAWENSAITVAPPDWWVKDPNNRAYKSPDAKRLKFQDSYWWDLYCSMALAISVMRSQWNQVDTGMTLGGDVHDFDVANLFPPGMRDPASYQSIRDLDRQFLAELGESLEAPGTGTPDDLTARAPGAGHIQAFRINWRSGWPWGPAPAVFTPWTARNNIKSAMDQDLLKSGSPNGDPNTTPPTPPGGMTSQDRAKSLERVLNDWRLAFFGSSPEYSDGIDPVTGIPDPLKEFRPLDFDGDGIVHCSCYQNPVGAPVINPGMPAEGGGRGPKPDPRMYFAPTGTFYVGKSHYYRIVTRGELWDNRFHTILNEACLESVLCVDPEGNNIKDTQTIFQRWVFDKYQGQLSHIRP